MADIKAWENISRQPRAWAHVSGATPHGMQLVQPMWNPVPWQLFDSQLAALAVQASAAGCTPLIKAILGPVQRSWQMGCCQESSITRPYKEAVVLPGELTPEKRREIREYVLDKLRNAADQSSPLAPSCPEKDVLTSEDHVNTTFHWEVARVVSIALQRCGIDARFVRNGLYESDGSLPIFQWMLAGMQCFCGGVGKAPSVLRHVDGLLHANDPEIRKALEHTLSYNRDYGWDWSFLTTLEKLWLFEKVPGAEHYYRLYGSILWNGVNPSQREMLFYVVHKTLSDNKGKWDREMTPTLYGEASRIQGEQEKSTGTEQQDGGLSRENGPQDDKPRCSLRSKRKREADSEGVRSKSKRQADSEGVRSKRKQEAGNEGVRSKRKRQADSEGVLSKRKQEACNDGVLSKRKQEACNDGVCSKHKREADSQGVRSKRKQEAGSEGVSSGATRATYRIADGQLSLTNVCLGHGASGDIILGRHNGHDAAIKVAEPSQEQALVKQLKHEAAIYQKLQLLQGLYIPFLLGSGYCKDDALFYLATSLMEGHHPTRGCKDALPLAIDALSQVHAQGVLHGDISSDNILISLPQADSSTGMNRMQVWLLDFGQSSTVVTPAACQEEMDQLYRVFGSL